MARDDAPPFDRGQTWYGQGATIDANNLGADSICGKEWVFEDENYNPSSGLGAKPTRSPRKVTVRAVRNTSPVNLLPKRLVQFDNSNPTGTSDSYGRAVNGYVNTTAGRGYPVDEFLPAAGVAPNDVFYIVVKGPAMCHTDNAALGANVNIGDQVVAGTFASSTNTTQGGLVQSQDLSGATQLLANQIRHAVGRALSAATTAQTNIDILLDVGSW